MKIPKYIIKKIIQARKLSEKLDAIRSEIIEWDYKVGAEHISFHGVNSNNLSEAIQCYIDYGEELDVFEYDNELIGLEDFDFKKGNKE